ncbi:MAG TPA: xanthine dehydrogenase family protein molybdopterin-binding subunit [Sporichthyaceae bacterium]
MTTLIGIGAPARIEAPQKVTGTAHYAGEVPAEGVAYAWPVGAAIASGRVLRVDAATCEATAGVIAVLTAANAPRLTEIDDAELMLLQSPAVAYRGQVVALVVAETEETAREAAEGVHIEYETQPHDVVVTQRHPALETPETVNPNFPAVSSIGDPEAALRTAPVVVDATYSTPELHNQPMEPHTSTARWDGGRLTLWESTQGTTSVAADLAQLFGLAADQVRVYAEHVGGGFGSKGTARPNTVLAAMAARVLGRPVRLALPRRAMFFLVGHRTPTIQRIRLGADPDGRLLAVDHDVVEHTSRIVEFAEQTAVPTRSMYAAANMGTRHRLARLDVPTPRWMRAPGECPGMFALECAMDELALAVGADPIELRVRNEPGRDPETGKAFSSRNLVACLQDGAARFGWDAHAARPSRRRSGDWLVGTGVAASTYPTYIRPSGAQAHADADGTFTIGINATDIGTGARTVLHAIAAEALGVDPARVRVHLADSALPEAPVAGGSAGTASWGWAVTKVCHRLLEQIETQGVGPEGVTVGAHTKHDIAAGEDLTRAAYGAQFAEVGVDIITGEIRLRRLLGVFAAGRILNARTARSQLVGGMTMGVSMALHEEGRIDPGLGLLVNSDLASYHLATAADTAGIEAHWIDEHDDALNPMGSKGIGEIGIVGTAAAIANAVFDATGVRVRDLPLRLDRLLGGLPD